MKVLLVCGSGASSGFLASNMRKCAKLRGLDLEVIARSESEIENYANEIDALMIAPHLDYLAEEIREYIDNKNLKILLIERSYYATLDGDKTIDQLLAAD